MTLIEILVVLAILVTLTAFLVPQVGRLRGVAYKKASIALVKKIEVALKAYYSEFRDYPPDGFDSKEGYTIESGGGIALGDRWIKQSGAKRIFKNTGCLVYFLTVPLTKITRIGMSYGQSSAKNLRRTRVGPFLSDMKSENYSITEFETLKLHSDPKLARVEFVDAWGRPLEYDKLKSSKSFISKLFDGTASSKKAHWTETLDRLGLDESTSDCGLTEDPAKTYDPRRPYKTDAASEGCIDTAKKPAPRSSGHFDLWSHGELWTDPADDLGGWNVN